MEAFRIRAADEAKRDSNKETGGQPIMIAGLDSLGQLLERPSTRIAIVETDDFLLRERYCIETQSLNHVAIGRGPD
jgi:hypothetical protein